MPLALYCPATARVRGGQLLYSRCPMQDFYAIVHKDEHSAFGVSFPDLPGCFSSADRVEDIVPNAREALALWFDDTQEVVPSRLDQVEASVADELASGTVFIVAVPWIANDAARAE